MMDLPSIQWQEHVAQKWTGLDPELRGHFTSLLEIDDVFKCALTLTTQDDLDFMQSISAEYHVHKDESEAARYRERGNSSFKRREYTAAALHYSQGICFAPQTSEQLSLCLANRSAALCHLQRYQESLDDIDAALKSGYPSHLVHKLEERRTQCMKHLPVTVKAKEDHHSPERSTKTSPGALTLSICSAAAVQFSTEKGRHLVATERITAGEELLHDRPYTCVLIPGMEEVKGAAGGRGKQGGQFGPEHRHCHRCLAETLRPVPCEGCSYSRYCSTPCQRDAWEEHHRWECPMGADLRAMGVMSQLALRVALKAGLENIQMAREPIRDEHSNSEGSQSEHPDLSASHHGDSYLSVFHLLHHLDRHSTPLRFLCAFTAAALYLKLTDAAPPPAASLLSRPPANSQSEPDQDGGLRDWSSERWLMGSAVLRHFLQLRCNAQAICVLQDTGGSGAEISPVQSSSEIRLATAIFPTLSLLNHSCSPNTSLVFSTGSGWDPSETDVSGDSCGNVPESRSSSFGVAVTVRAAKVIPAGQEILHCYGPHSSRMGTKERQRLLQEQYFFSCHCEACKQQQQQEEKEEEEEEEAGPQESGLVCGECKGSLKQSTKEKGKAFICTKKSCGHHISSSEVSGRLLEIRVDLETAVDLMEREQPDEALSILKRVQSRSGLILAETHPLQGELADATARAYATIGDWKNAASHLERSAAAVSRQYGEDSIEVARQLFKLAQLHFNGGARGPAMAVISKVRRLLCLHCGPRCQELEELQAMERCLRG